MTQLDPTNTFQTLGQIDSLTVVVLLGLGHRPEEVGRALHGLALVLDDDLVHADLVGAEHALPARPRHVEVEGDGAEGAEDLGRDGVGAEVLVQDVDLEVALEEKPKRRSLVSVMGIFDLSISRITTEMVHHISVLSTAQTI